MKRGASRLFRFALGLFVGILALPALGLIGALGAYVIAIAPPQASFAPSEARGRDISAGGGVSVAMSNDGKAIRLTCHETCDDLVVSDGAGDEVEVRDARGKRLVSRKQAKAPWFLSRPKAWFLGGHPLSIRDRGAS